MARWKGVVLGTALLLAPLGVPSAYADVISPEEDACRSQEEGDDCEVDDPEGFDGECVASQCGRLSYGPDGGPPTSVDYDCLVCEETSGCSVGGAGSSAAPWLVAFGLSLCVAGLRRRKPR